MCTLCMYLAAISVLVALDIGQNYALLSKDAYFKSGKFKNQLVVYNEMARVSNNLDLSKSVDEMTLKDAKDHVQMEQSIRYYLKNKSNGEVFTNISVDYDVEKYIKDKAIHVERFPQNIGPNWEYEEMNYWFRKNNIDGVFALIESNDMYSQIKKDYVYYNSIRNRLIKEIKLGTICIFAMVLLILSMKKFLKIKGHNVNLTEKYEKIPLDLRVLIFVICIFLIKAYTKRVQFFYKPINIRHFQILTYISVCTMFIVTNLKSFTKIIFRKDIRVNQWEHSIAFKIRKLRRESAICKDMMKSEARLLVFTMLFGASFIMCIYGLLVSYSFIVFITSIYNVIYLMFVPQRILNRVHDINSIINSTDDIISGKMEIPIENLSNSEFIHISKNINNMKQIYKDSMESQVKSERLKAELITNVSHDLKTPLTSIINYIKLLKNQSISEEEKEKYIEVLDKKSQRLKILIDDLFEAAKASSGSVELNVEKVDIAMLLRQALGEFEDKIANTSLTFRTSIPENPVYSNLDGRRTWRVFENIIGNSIKYSQDSSRVYVDLKTDENNAIVTVKNVSNYEMNFEASEIFHRFKRGDMARSTEGSGLGLSIAKSLVELQNGSMDIEIDGDLFKLIISFPLVK